MDPCTLADDLRLDGNGLSQWIHLKLRSSASAGIERPIGEQIGATEVAIRITETTCRLESLLYQVT